MMPTMGKVAAAVLFAALFGWVMLLAAGRYPADDFPPTGLVGIAVFMGLVIGWRFAGSRSGRAGWNGAISYGLTTGVMVTFCTIFFAAFWRMIELSLRKTYKGPFEAIAAVFSLMWEITQEIYHPDLLALLAAGSLVAGLLIEFTARHWR